MPWQLCKAYLQSYDSGLSAKDPFNGWGGGGCNNFVPVLRRNGTKIAPTGDMFDEVPGQMR